MSAAEIGRKIDVPPNRVTQILNGTRSITGDTALRLAEQRAGKSIRDLSKLKRRDPVHA